MQSLGPVIGDILPLAIGVAISVVPIIAVILMLFTKRAKVNSVAFLLGWVIGLVVAGGIALAVSGGSDAGGDAGEPQNGIGILKLLLGVALLFGAYRNWQKRPKEGEDAEMPGWMASIDEFSSPKSFGLAAVLSGVNPKNLALTIAAATSIAASGLTTGEQIVVLAVFIAIASVTVAGPVLAYLILGHKADETLNSMKEWLVTHNDAVMAVLFLVFGVKLVGDGLVVLTS